MRRITGRARGMRRAPLAALACALTLFAVSAVLPSTSAAFSAATANAANAVSSDQLAPPSGLVASQTCATPAAIAFRAAGTATGMDTLTFPMPAGTARGDVLLVQVAYAYTTATLSAPGGWDLVRRDTSSTVVVSALFEKAAGAAEPSATFSFPTGSGVQMAGGVAAYTGVSTTAPVDVSGGVSGYGQLATTPAVTTTTANTMLVRLITNVHEAYPAPAGTTQRWRLAVGGWSGGGVTAADEPFAGPGTAAARTSASPSGTSDYGIGQTVALRRGPGTPSAALSWTASPSTWATGYQLERSTGGTVQGTSAVSPVGTTSATDGPLVIGTAYTFRLWAHRGSWTSPAVTATLTPAC